MYRFHFTIFLLCGWYCRSSLYVSCEQRNNIRCMYEERKALLIFKSKLIDETNQLASWAAENEECCTWVGISCDTSTGHVHGIHLRALNGNCYDQTIMELQNTLNRRLKGNISRSLLKLKHLKHLDLSCNYFEGSQVPKFIGYLHNLRYLNLSNSRFIASLPDSLGQLSKLITLELSSNSLAGVVTQTHFQKLVNLKHLSAKQNNLILKLEDEKWIPPFHLEYLDLSCWILGPQFPLWLKTQNNLTCLNIRNTSISSIMPDLFIGSFHSLNYLEMSENKIKGALALFSDISPNIDVLVLSNNEFFGPLDHFLCSSGGVKHASYLLLSNNHLAGVIPNCWENWPNLRVLVLENNNFSGVIPRALVSSPCLEVLDLGNNKFSGELPTPSTGQTRLKLLQLGNNEIVGRIPTWIGTRLGFLQILSLRNNKFSGDIPEELCYLSHVHVINLAQNKLSGNIPRCLNNLSFLSGKESPSLVEIPWTFFFKSATIIRDSLVTKAQEVTYINNVNTFTLLDLSSNNLVGHIPSELTSLRGLNFLNLSSNYLTGKIPEKIGDMEALESIDLSINNLSGELPLSLTRLNFLSHFNISHNNLTGRIPENAQFQSFSETGFFGNHLCGVTLYVDKCVAHNANVTGANDEKEEDVSGWGIKISIIVGGFCVGYLIIVGGFCVGCIRLGLHRTYDPSFRF